VPDRDFDEIVAGLQADQRQRRRRRGTLFTGVFFVAVAIALLLAGGVKGAVYAILPWLIGMFLVIKGRPR